MRCALFLRIHSIYLFSFLSSPFNLNIRGREKTIRDQMKNQEWMHATNLDLVQALFVYSRYSLCCMTTRDHPTCWPMKYARDITNSQIFQTDKDRIASSIMIWDYRMGYSDCLLNSFLNVRINGSNRVKHRFIISSSARILLPIWC